MDSINPWIDEDELTRLADSLLSPVKKSTDNTARNFASKSLAKASEQAKRAGILSADETAKTPLEELGLWLSNNASCEGICVVDRDGDVLHSTVKNAAWTALTVQTVRTQDSLEAGNSPSVRIKTNADTFLQFITVDTQRGTLMIGLLTRNFLQAAQLNEFAALVTEVGSGDMVK